ncbi:MAG: hypothetical protein ACREQ4_17900 [Candidatus Binataceae bacterium]
MFFLLALAALIDILAGPANADSVAVLPSQRQLSPSSNIHRQTGTAPPQRFPEHQGANIREIPLPRIFRGCWRGSVPRVDSLEPLDPNGGGIQWLTKVYTLCYEQIGAERWKLTFAEGSVAEPWRVRDERQRIQVKTVEGPNRARLVAYLHFRAPQVNAFSGAATGTVNTMDELTHLDCDVRPGGNTMSVRAQVFVENDGRPYAEISWHSSFERR